MRFTSFEFICRNSPEQADHTYAPSVSGNPTFNIFDATSQTWSGPGLMNNGGSGTPLSPQLYPEDEESYARTPHTFAILSSTDEGNGIYLAGSPSAGLMELNFISDFSAKTLDRVGSSLHTSLSSEASKACFTYPYPKPANRVIQILQFGSYSTVFVRAYPNGTFGDWKFFSEEAFISPRFFAWSGSSGDYNMFSLLTNYTYGGYSNWAGLRLSFSSNNTGNYIAGDLTTFPSADPLLAVGTYTTSAGSLSSGYTIVFDNASQGRAYLTSGSTVALPKLGLLTLAPYVIVNMNNIVLSKDALGITMAGTAYILDKANSGFNTVIYSITPGAAFELKQVNVKGGAPPFLSSMAGAAYGKQIVTYSVPPTGGEAYFNSFDITTGTWSGSNLIYPPVPSPTPIGAIVGGVIGGLLVIALLVYLFIRRRNKQRRKIAAASVANANADKYTPASSTGSMAHIHDGEVVIPIQGQIFQGQHQRKQQQQAGFNYQPPILDPYAQFQNPDEPLNVPYHPPIKFFDPNGGNQVNGVPTNYDMIESQFRPTVPSVSPIASFVPYRTEPAPQYQQQHYSPVHQQQQQQQQQHYSPIQQQPQQQQHKPFSLEQPQVHAMSISAPMSGASKDPQFIP
ncbi:hypothetical protein K457DRAFT_13760 [Linnemannia elongata AG-77]|uniref:Uncharacterized protein n=1 Tax=Linnemannia elongata AG-77 TaxID=1314771 RepID=A0A197KFP7_9FUNG|nr:hypothetical protein K457DRAFT_13760 [Linnemannia elongata AG-77]